MTATSDSYQWLLPAATTATAISDDLSRTTTAANNSYDGDDYDRWLSATNGYQHLLPVIATSNYYCDGDSATVSLAWLSSAHSFVKAQAFGSWSRMIVSLVVGLGDLVNRHIPIWLQHVYRQLRFVTRLWHVRFIRQRPNSS